MDGEDVSSRRLPIAVPANDVLVNAVGAIGHHSSGTACGRYSVVIGLKDCTVRQFPLDFLVWAILVADVVIEGPARVPAYWASWELIWRAIRLSS